MTPHSQIPPSHYSNLPWYLLLCSGVAAKLEVVPMKLLVTFLCGIIGFLVYWGSSTTLDRLKTMEAKQDVIQHTVVAGLQEMHKANAVQDVCITEIRERQNGVLKTLEQLKEEHKKAYGGGGK